MPSISGGVMLSWQWTYATSVYLVSFFVAGRHRLISGTDQLLCVWGTNSFWVLLGLFGPFVSIRLIVDGDYTVLGYW